MEKNNWIKIIIDTLLAVLTTSFITFTFTNFVQSKQCDVNISKSIVDGGVIMTPISISNNSDNKKVEELDISVGEFNEIVSVISSLSYVPDKNNNIITLENIPPDYTTSIILITKEVINLDSIKIASSGSVKITYLENKTMIYTLIISQVIFYSIMLFIVQYIQGRMTKKLNLECDRIENNLKESTIDLDKLKKENIEIKKIHKELRKDMYNLRIYNFARLKDYKKELDFWKDTIRKLIYESSKGELNANKIFDTVTKSLKTYGVKSNSDNCFDEIIHLADLMNEFDKEKYK